MAFRSVLQFLDRWLRRCGQACCVGRSQTALSKTLERKSLPS